MARLQFRVPRFSQEVFSLYSSHPRGSYWRLEQSVTEATPPLRVLMSACVPRRREGGVAAVVYNIGEELTARGHSVIYLFQEDLCAGSPVRFRELIFAHRLSQYISENRHNFSVVNLHAPAGFLYGLRRKWLRQKDLPPYVMTLHGLHERRGAPPVPGRPKKAGRGFWPPHHRCSP